VAVARVGGLHVLGTYAILNVTLLLCLGLSRMLVMEPWLVSKATMSVTPALRWLLVCSSLTGAVVVTCVAVIVGSTPTWLILVIVMLAWIPQDAGRFMAFKSRRPSAALLSDAVVLVSVATGAFLASNAGSADQALALLLGSWALGQTVGLVTIFRQLTGRIAYSGSARWWKLNLRVTAMSLTHDGFAYLAANNVSLYVLAATASASDVGLIRITTSMFSPVALAFTGLTMWLVPVLTRLSDSEARATQKRVSSLLAIMSVPVLLAAVWIGPEFVSVVFHVDRVPSRVAIATAGLATSLVAIGSPWVASAKVQGRYRPVAWSRTVAAVVTLASLAFFTPAQTAEGFLLLILLQNVLVPTTAVVAIRARKTLGSQTGSESESALP